MPLIRKPELPVAGDVRDAPAVLDALGSADADRRWTAARAAVDLPGADVALAAALGRESDARVREAIFTSLARIGSDRACDTLFDALRSESAAERSGALGALRLLPGLAVMLPRLLEDPDSDVRVLSCDLARALPTAVANRLLCDLLERETLVNVCAAAVDVLAEVGQHEALDTLNACLRRFCAEPFLVFAITTVVARISAITPGRV